jgi:RNA polymerase sigma factor (sigma-70 family)
MITLNDNHNLIELVNKAKAGCQTSMDSLAQMAHGTLFSYIYRLTLNNDLAEDLQQETLLEMVRSLKNLRNPERFWPWLYRTALSKVQHHYRQQKYEKQKQAMSPSDKERLLQRVSGNYGDGLRNMISNELVQSIIDAMTDMNLKYRNVLILRCCQHLSYSEISEIMNCKKMTAQVLFYRAKHLLRKKLAKHPLGKGLFVTVIGVFGQMTSPADSAEVAMPIASAKVSVSAAIIGTLVTNLWLTITAMFTVAALIIGSLSFQRGDILDYKGVPARSEIKSFHFVKQGYDKIGSVTSNIDRGNSLSKGAYEQWYYFPDGIDGPMLMMMQRWNPVQTKKLCGWLQNGSGNYYYESSGKIIYTYNYHLPMRYLETRRLPSDTAEFTEFLDKIEGPLGGVDYIRDPKTGLLVGALDTRFYNAKNFKSSIIYNKVDEQVFGSFRFTWPTEGYVDERDEMHKLGWTYFRITGQIKGQQVNAKGRLPFIFDALAGHSPWLNLEIGQNLKITDSQFGACIADKNGNIIAAYPAGSFFIGLARPWMGFNAIDIVRRDAAAKKVTFDLKNSLDENSIYGKAQITMPANQTRIVYSIDIDKDLIEKIEFFKNGDNENISQGVLKFTHLDKSETLTESFAAPAKIKIPKSKYRNNNGMLWLDELAQGTLGR